MNGADDFSSKPADGTSGPTSTGTPGSPYAGAAYTDTAGEGRPHTGAQGYGAPGSQGPAYAAYGAVPPPPGTPNPGLATLLGFIPGVGAMYNGQFAKGLAHIIIFGVLISLSDHVNGIFGLLVGGWYIYMVFDAYQTARAHRDGMQAPDPFGLNNIGERFGIGQGPNWSDFQAKPVPGSAPSWSADGAAPSAGAPFPGTPAQTAYSGSAGPSTAYPGPQTAYPGSQTAYQTPDVRYGTGPQGTEYQDVHTAYASGANPYGGGPSGAPGQPGPTYTTPYPGAQFAGMPYGAPMPPPITPAFDAAARSRSGLPSGAIWLIGLGVLALAGSLNHDSYWTGRYFAGGFVLLLGAVLLVQQMLSARGVYPAHSAAANWYALRSIKGGVFLMVIGILLLLGTTDSSYWHQTHQVWPYLLILFGVYQVVERVAYNRMLAVGNAPGEVTDEMPYRSGTTQASASSSSMPSIQPRDEEGR